LPRLKAARDLRARPARDDKRVVSWNALAISALARAGVALGEPGWIAEAVAAAEFLLGRARVEGRWYRTYKDGKVRSPAFADDHANLLAAFLDLWEATFDPRWLAEVEAVAGQLVDLFWDDEAGALWLVGRDHPPLVARGRPGLGGAEPGALGVTALSFVRAARLLGRDDLEERASRLLSTIQPLLPRAPRALGLEALAGAWLVDGGSEIAVVGPARGEDTRALLAEVRRRYLPFAVVARLEAPSPALPWTEGKVAVGDRATAYVCEGFTCQLPTSEPAEVAAQLDRLVGAGAATGPVALLGPRIRAPELPSAPELWLGTDVPLTLERLRGQVVVLDFWSYCCINCHHVLPVLRQLEERHAGQPLVVVGVHSAKFPAEQIGDNVRRAVQRHEIRHPVVLDGEHEVWEEYAIRSWPTVVVVDATGRIAWQHSGEVEAEELMEIVDGLLAEAAAAGTAAAPIPVPGVARDPGGELRFPGKVHVWPDAFEQEMGTDPWPEARLYVADTGHHRVLELALTLGADGWPTGHVLRVFGSGEPGFTDGPSGSARLRGPQGIRRHGTTLYVADTENHALRAVDLTDGTVRTLAGTGRKGTAAPTRDQLANPLTADLRSPWDVEVMSFRSHHLVFVAMAGSHQIWVYGQGHIGIHAGSGREEHVDGPAASAALAQPSGLALLGRYLLFSDSETSSIRAVDLQSHHVVTVVGRGLFDFGDVDGPSDSVRLQHPLGLTFADDVVYVADTYNHKIRAIGLGTGQTRSLVGGDRAVLCEPGGVARAGRHLIVADTNNHRLRVVDTANGAIRDLVWQA
jgi:thiol-disulfide isomerase/thioredoxin